MGRQNQVRFAWLDRNVAHCHVRQAAFELRPVPAAINRNEKPELGPHEQKIGIDQIFAHHMGVAAQL